MASVKGYQSIFRIAVSTSVCAGICLLTSSHCAAQSGSSEPTPDPYFKPVAKKPDFSDTYVPPSFSPGSIGKKIPETESSKQDNRSVPWSHQRSIVRDRTQGSNNKNNDFAVSGGVIDSAETKTFKKKHGFLKSRGNSIQLASAESPVEPQEGVRVASRPSTGSTTKVETVKQFESSKVVALVGGEPIFVGDMLFEANQIIESKIPQAPEAAKQVQRKRLLKAMTKKFVDQKLLYVDAMGQLPAEASVEDLVSQATGIFDEQVLPDMMKSSGVDSITEFDGNLRVQGSSLRQVRLAWAKDQLARQFMQQSLNVNQTITHQEMLDEYLADKEKYAIRARSKWEQIMVRFDKSESRKEAKKKIAELGNQIIHGANLSAVAKKSSDGFRASKGGQHDWTGKGALVLKEIDEAIFTLPTGRLSDIIESRDGYHIVRVIERTEASHTPFTEAQVEIKKRLKNEKLNAAFEKHLKSVRERIPVEYFPLD